MQVLIVGCGYLGSVVARSLVSQGHTVFATTRSQEKARTLSQTLQVQTLVVDLLDPHSLEDLPAVDAVVHCVAYDRRSGHSRQAVSVQGLRNLLKALPTSVRWVVSTSSTSVYGLANPQDVTEETPPDPATEAGRVCLEAESVITEQAHRFQACVILRLSGLYGPGRIIRRDSLLRGEPIATNPDAWLNLVHIDDAAAAVVAALKSPNLTGLQLVNVTDDQPGPRRRYYELAAQLLDAPAPQFLPDSDPLEAGARRRISNARLKSLFLPALTYPTIEQGLPAALADERLATDQGTQPVA